MRHFTSVMAFLLTLSLAGVAAAVAPEEDEEEYEPGPAMEYAISVKHVFLGGVNGVVTFPADPVMMAVDTPKTLLDLPGGKVTGPLVGFFGGLFQGTYRLTMGALDLGFAPFRIFPTLSPLWRYKPIPGWEHEDE